MNPHFLNGTLILPGWTYAGKDARVPHRSNTLAFHRDGNTQFYVCANHKHSLFWVHAVGPGFAGEHSRASLTCATRNKALAESWISAVGTGKVRISP